MGAARVVEKALDSLAGRLACVTIALMLSAAACWSLPATMQAAAAWRTAPAATLTQPQQQDAAGRDEGRLQQQSAAAYAVLSSGSNPLYSFFIPLTALVWRRRQQFEPLIILLNDVRDKAGGHGNWSSSAHTSVVLAYLDRWSLGLNTLAVEHDEAAGKNNAALLSQLSRLFAAGMCGSAAAGGLSRPESWLVTTDVDIWPVAPASFWLPDALASDDSNPSNPSLGKITNAYCCSAGYSVLGLRVSREYPMTTAAFQVKTWQQLLNYTCICSSPQHCSTALSSHMNRVAQRVFNMRAGVAPPEQWYYDQRLLSYSVHARPDIHNRTQLVARPTNADRIDRIAWPRVEPGWSEQLLQRYVDAHVLRPGYAEHHWRPLLQLLRPLLRLNLTHGPDAQLWQEVQQYQREFADAMSTSVSTQARSDH